MPPPPHAHDPLAAAVTLAGALQGTVTLAHALLVAHRPIDLAGLDHDVGLLCARALDLPHDQGRALLPTLTRLANAVDTLTASIEHEAATPT